MRRTRRTRSRSSKETSYRRKCLPLPQRQEQAELVRRACSRKIATRIDPEVYDSRRAITFNRYGLMKAAGGKFSEIDTGGNQFAIERPGGGHHIDPEKALANNRGYVYAAVNAKAREVQNIDFRLFEVDGEDHEEKTDHALLDLLGRRESRHDRRGAEVPHVRASRSRRQLLLASH